MLVSLIKINGLRVIGFLCFSIPLFEVGRLLELEEGAGISQSWAPYVEVVRPIGTHPAVFSYHPFVTISDFLMTEHSLENDSVVAGYT